LLEVIVFEVVVNGEVLETIKPTNQRLKVMCDFVKEQMIILRQKYGNSFVLNRRVIY
jgi:hypothetical protein